MESLWLIGQLLFYFFYIGGNDGLPFQIALGRFFIFRIACASDPCRADDETRRHLGSVSPVRPASFRPLHPACSSLFLICLILLLETAAPFDPRVEPSACLLFASGWME